MEDLLLGRISALVPEFAVKDLPLGRTLMMIMIIEYCRRRHESPAKIAGNLLRRQPPMMIAEPNDNRLREIKHIHLHG